MSNTVADDGSTNHSGAADVAISISSTTTCGASPPPAPSARSSPSASARPPPSDQHSGGGSPNEEHRRIPGAPQTEVGGATVSRGGGLPVTGSDVAGLVAVGAAAIAVGSGAVAVSKRRTRLSA